MGLFSRLFKPKNKITAATLFGTFELTYSKRNKNTWTKSSGEYLISVQGTDKEPDERQLRFIERIEDEVLHLNKAITIKFTSEFLEAGLDPNFTDWAQRFRVIAIDIVLIFQKKTYWNITFEDTKEPYSNFTLYIEGKRITDFSIDT